MRISSTIIGICAAGALFAGGVFTGQRWSKPGFADAVDKAGAKVESGAGNNAAHGAASDISKRIRAQEAEVKRARQEMLSAMKKQGPGDLAGRHQLTLERDLSKLAVQLKTLKNLNGDDFFRGAIEMGIGDSTVQKFYPEYQAELTTLSAISASGFGPKHPKVLGLKESIRLKAAQLEAAAESLEVAMNVQLETGHKLIADARERSGSGPGDADDEYTAARKRYESQLNLLEQLKEQAGESRPQDAERRHRLPGSDGPIKDK